MNYSYILDPEILNVNDGDTSRIALVNLFQEILLCDKDGVINSKYPIYNYSPGSKQIDGVTSATSQYFANKGLLYTYRDGKRVDTTHLHVKDWLDSIRNGSQPKCDIEVAFQEGVTCAMATESYLKGKRIEWDPINRRLV